MRVFNQLALAALVIFAGEVSGQTRLTVTPDRANVVASRLLGDWGPDSALTLRLTGRQPRTPAAAGENAAGRVSFKSDPSVVQKVPQPMVNDIMKMVPPPQVFLAGSVTIVGRDHPFLLLTLNGNMQVLYFQERNGDPMGDEESFIVQLAIAAEPANDILLVGGDFNNQPFSAYKRVAPPGSSSR